MSEKGLTPFQQEVIDQLSTFKQEVISRLDATDKRQNTFEQEVISRFKAIDQYLNAIESDIREIRSDISRIDANIEIMATSQGYPYSKEKRILSAFERKVS